MTAYSYYTEGQIKRLIKSMVLLVDTREKENNHILNYCDKKNFTYENRALKSGDYSALIPPDEELGIILPQTLNKPIDGGIFIERKNSLEELSSNLGLNRDRFEAELERMKGAEKHLIVEDGSWEKIISGEYLSKLSPNAFHNSLMTFQSRYGLHIHFISKPYCGALIRGILENKFKEVLSL